jgi:hypothetical protein
MTTIDTNACASCGHAHRDHFWGRCFTCEREDYFCECDEDDMDLDDGCHECDCEGYRKPKPITTEPDPDQLSLFG